MYEENLKPLPEGDASVVFAQEMTEMKRHATASRPAEVTPESVVRWANKENQPVFAAMCRRLLLPGSGIQGIEHLNRLAELAREGNACLLCLNHRSNLDVPTLDTLLEDHGDAAIFNRIIWIAGRKLEEDVGLTSLLVQCFNRVIVTPHSWLEAGHSDDELHRARLINIAAERAVSRLRHEGWVFALFPTGTRLRPDDESTRQAIGETYSYLRMFEYLALCHIDGCTLPVSKDRDLTHETPTLNRMTYSFSEVQRTEDWLANAEARYTGLDQRTASARAMSEDIEALQQ